MAAENVASLKIRLLSGPYAEHEIVLPEGPVTLGNSSECDFIVHDPDKEDKQKEKKDGVEVESSGSLKLELVVNKGSVLLQTKPEEPALKILINGEPAEPKDNQLVLPEKKIIEIGKIAFVLGAEKQDLSNIKKQKAPKSVGRYSTNVRAPSKKIILVAGTFVVSAMVVAALFFFKPNKPAPSITEITKKEMVAKLHKQVAGLTDREGLKDIKASWKKNNILGLSGYVASLEIKTPLLNSLSSLGVGYDDNIIDLDGLVSSTTFLLQSKGYKRASVAPDKRPGFIIITGKILGNSRWDEVSKQLMKNITGLKGWHIVSTQTQFSGVLLSLLSDRGISRLLSVVDRDNITFITGLLNNEQADTLNNLIDEAKEKAKSTEEVIYQNIPYSGSLYPEYIPSPLTSFGGDNESAYFILENGMRCNVGTQLPSGYIITSIGKDGITLEKSGDVAHFPVFA